MDYEVVVGLEVHAELSTKTKIFCGCENKFGAEVNTQCCPVCTGMPGTLPVLNKKVVEYAIKAGFATNCKINERLKQDRKNYVYPDLPKAYQISQFDIPLCEHGVVKFMLNGEEKQVRLARIHIEEDAGKLLHKDGIDSTLVDLNRCGVPLIEIVSEPDIRSSEEAKAYLETLKNILQYIDVSDCKMQEGSIRCDVNVSIRPKGSSEYGTRCEMKNVNTFSGAQRAIDYEVNRQKEILESGGTVLQQTRRWDDELGESILMRSKEDAQDYRYFPEPDIIALTLDENWIEDIRKSIPELPNEKQNRYVNDYKLSEFDAMMIASNYAKAVYFDECCKLNKVKPQNVSNWIMGDIAKYLNDNEIEIDELCVTPSYFVKLIELVEKNTISSTAAKKVFKQMLTKLEDPQKIVDDLGLAQNSNEDELLAIVKKVIENNPKSVEDFKKGKTNVVGFLVGQCMRESKGKANPVIVNKMITQELSK